MAIGTEMVDLPLAHRQTVTRSTPNSFAIFVRQSSP